MQMVKKVRKLKPYSSHIISCYYTMEVYASFPLCQPTADITYFLFSELRTVVYENKSNFMVDFIDKT